MARVGLKAPVLTGKTKNARPTYDLCGLGLNIVNKECYSYTTSIINAWHAALYRVFLPRKENGQRVAAFPCHDITPFQRTRAAWNPPECPAPLSRPAYAARFMGPKGQAYLREGTQLDNGTHKEYNHFKQGGQCKVQGIVKFERYMKVTDPRMITMFPRWYNIELGRYYCQIEQPILQSFNAMCGFTACAKGLNMEARASALKAHMKPDCIAIGLDVSRWDSGVSNATLKEEFRFYDVVFRSLPDNERKYLLSLLALQYSPKVKCRSADGHFSYKSRRGFRSSGTPNTGTGNTLLQFCMLYDIHARLRALGINSSFICDGDDAVFFLRKEFLYMLEEGGPVDIRDAYMRSGFNLTIEEPVDELSAIEFCQAKPVCVDGHWIMVRSINALYKDGFTLHNMDSKFERQRWLAAIAAAAPCFAKIPIYGAFYERFSNKLTVADDLPVSGLTSMIAGTKTYQRTREAIQTSRDSTSYTTRRGHTYRALAKVQHGYDPSQISDSTRLSFWEAMERHPSLLPSHQMEIERKIMSMPYINTVDCINDMLVCSPFGFT